MNKGTQAYNTFVLLIDDDQKNIRDVEKSIETFHESFQVTSLQNVHEGLNLLNSGNYDLLIIDWNTIKKSTFDPLELPTEIAILVVLNEDTSFVEVEKITKLRTTVCIRKPITTSELLVRINNLMHFVNSEDKVNSNPARPVQQDRVLQDEKNRELSSKILEINHKTRVLEVIRCKLEGLLPHIDEELKMSFKELITTVKMTTNDKESLKTFSRYFDNIHPEFFSYFRQHFTKLTIEDIRYCAYLKMQMSNREIAILLNINQESVRTHKYRLKKKMELGKEINLQKFIDDQTTSVSVSYN